MKAWKSLWAVGFVLATVVVASRAPADVDLGLTQTSNPSGSVVSGNNVTLTLTVTGSGASSLTVTDVLPSVLQFVSATPPSGGACANNSGTVVCTLPSLSSTQTFQIVARAVGSGTAKNVAGVVSGENESAPANNSSTLSITIATAQPPSFAPGNPFNPTSGPVGTTVTINGSNFSSPKATFDTTDVTPPTWTAGSFSVAAPNHTAGAVTVRVTNADGQSAVASQQFTYTVSPSPTVTQVSPAIGVYQGGTSVTITGTGFLDNAAVTFGSGSATNVVRNSATELTAKTPAGTAGQSMTVTVTNPDGKSGSLPNAFTYVNQLPPQVSSLSPYSGSSLGSVLASYTVYIYGSSFNQPGVSFGGVGAQVKSSTATQIAVDAPPHVPGTVNVTVTNMDGQGAQNTPSFQYVAAQRPSPTSFSPQQGSLIGQDPQSPTTIYGSGFASGAKVRFGSVEATSTVFVSSTELRAVAPPAASPQFVSITVTNVDTQSGTTPSTFQYIVPTPTATSNSPICSGGTLNLFASTVPGATGYSWSGPQGFTSTLQNPTISNVTVSQSGTYTVFAKMGSYTSNFGSATVSVGPDTTPPTVTPPPQLTVNQTVCKYGSLPILPGTTLQAARTKATSYPARFGGVFAQQWTALSKLFNCLDPNTGVYACQDFATDSCSATTTRQTPTVSGTAVGDQTFIQLPIDVNNAANNGKVNVTFGYRDAASNLGTATQVLRIIRGGDVNLDGMVDTMDGSIIQNEIVGNISIGTAPFLANGAVADADDSGLIDNFDVILLNSFIVGNSSCLVTNPSGITINAGVRARPSLGAPVATTSGGSTAKLVPVGIDMRNAVVGKTPLILGGYLVKVTFDPKVTQLLDVTGGLDEFSEAPIFTSPERANREGVALVTAAPLRPSERSSGRVLSLANLAFRELVKGGISSVKVEFQQASTPVTSDGQGGIVLYSIPVE